jgi:hypothetical protein
MPLIPEKPRGRFSGCALPRLRFADRDYLVTAAE